MLPGEGVLISRSRPLRFHHVCRARGWTFDVSDARIPDSRREGPVLVDLQGGLGSVVSAMISTVSAQHRCLDGYEFTRSCVTIGDLLYACMLDRGDLPDTLGSVEQAVRNYVARHACDPALTPASVARSLGWSIRQIQLAFQGTGTTTSDLIRLTRIIRAKDLLCKSPPDATIGSVAFAAGFRSISTFNAVFKKEFGLSSREARALHQAGEHCRTACDSNHVIQTDRTVVVGRLHQ